MPTAGGRAQGTGPSRVALKMSAVVLAVAAVLPHIGFSVARMARTLKMVFGDEFDGGRLPEAGDVGRKGDVAIGVSWTRQKGAAAEARQRQAGGRGRLFLAGRRNGRPYYAHEDGQQRACRGGSRQERALGSRKVHCVIPRGGWKRD